MEKLQASGFWNALAIGAQALGQLALPGSWGTGVSIASLALASIAAAFARPHPAP